MQGGSGGERGLGANPGQPHGQRALPRIRAAGDAVRELHT